MSGPIRHYAKRLSAHRRSFYRLFTGFAQDATTVNAFYASVSDEGANVSSRSTSMADSLLLVAAPIG